jgi:hypothetical protein
MTKHRSHLPKWIATPETSKRGIFEAVAEEQRLSPEAVEKDWWLVLALDLVFSMSCGRAIVFKGGTSLSKGWGLIQRFSEDIDLVLDREFLGFSGELGKNQRDKLRKASVQYALEEFAPELEQAFIQKGFPEVKVVPLEPKSSDNDPVKIDIYFTKLTVADSYLKPGLQIELGARSLREPFSEVPIQSLVSGSPNFKNADFADNPIVVPLVNPERTFLEKIFLLHEEHQRPKENQRVDRLSRHLYDIFQLESTAYKDKALSDSTLYNLIVAHRERYSRVSGVDYKLHRPEMIRFIPPDNVLPAWEKDYQLMQESMIYGESPSFTQLIASLAEFQSQLNQKRWKN